MAKVIDVRNGRALLDIASYAQRGPGRRDHLAPAELSQIERTVRRDPEVMVKVLSHGEQSLNAIQAHLNYIGRKGELDLETDDGEHWQGNRIGKALLEDWDLDLEVARRRADLWATTGHKPPKLVHKLMLSMPPGTPPHQLLAAVGNFAREEFGLKHRYAMVLHTDEPHPHVHMVVKAMSEQSIRLHIRKATLRKWREEFARHLRAQGVRANATERAARGQSRASKKDGIYRAWKRGASTHMQQRATSLRALLLRGRSSVEPGKASLLQTRAQVESGWRALKEILVRQGQLQLAQQVGKFVLTMPLPMTDNERLRAQLQQQIRAR
jgi:hypothetical protein